ncbi:MAG: hypothetical protein AAF490_31535 [Chloroflexota bacterium]
MKLIFLHGPPASGKYTIAKAIESLIPCKNFHNHLTVDVAKALFEFGTDPFFELLRKLRLDALEIAARENIGTVVMTFCYSHPHGLPVVELYEQTILKYSGEFLPVFLQTSKKVLESRVVQSSRVKMRKVSTVEGLRKHQARWNNVALPRENCVIVTTDGKTAVQCAQEIIDMLKL